MFKLIKKKSLAAFSTIELLTVVVVLSVIMVILAPSLLSYVERTRAQKDATVCDEIVNAVEVAMASDIIFNEMYEYSCSNNFLTFSDSSGIYGSQEKNEEFWAPDGYGRAVTLTFNPEKKTYNMYKIAVNELVTYNGSLVKSRTIMGVQAENPICWLDECGDGFLYARLCEIMGEKVKLSSQTYGNSSFTIFIKFSVVDRIKKADIYGYFNGINLTDICMASIGTGTTSYDIDGKAMVVNTPVSINMQDTADFENITFTGHALSERIIKENPSTEATKAVETTKVAETTKAEETTKATETTKAEETTEAEEEKDTYTITYSYNSVNASPISAPTTIKKNGTVTIIFEKHMNGSEGSGTFFPPGVTNATIVSTTLSGYNQIVEIANPTGDVSVTIAVGCLAKGTKILTRDNETVNVEDLQVGDEIMTFNHRTGEFELKPVELIYVGEDTCNATTLKFTNDVSLSIILDHCLFELESMSYVTIYDCNAEDFIGHHFYNALTGEFEELLSVEREGPVEYYEIYTADNLNCIAEGMLNMPQDISCYLNMFEFMNDLTIDDEAFQRDIEKYGLYEAQGEEMNYPDEAKYLLQFANIIEGKGLSTLERMKAVYKEEENCLH